MGSCVRIVADGDRIYLVNLAHRCAVWARSGADPLASSTTWTVAEGEAVAAGVRPAPRHGRLPHPLRARAGGVMDPLQPAAAPVNLVALGYRALHDPRGRTYLVNTLARSAVVTSSAAPWESEAGWSPVSGGALVPVLAAAGCPMAVARLEAACAA